MITPGVTMPPKFKDVESFVRKCYGAPEGVILDISIKKTRDDIGVQLWRAVNIKDLSTARFYLALDANDVVLFDTDFMSRHEIVAQTPEVSLPTGWNEWGVVRGNNILVSNSSLFMRSMLTADAFVALPLYRFDQLADDIADLVSDTGKGVLPSTFEILTRPSFGYSFRMYDSEVVNNGETTEPCFEYSILKGMTDEGIDLCRPAFEQFQLRENGG